MTQTPYTKPERYIKCPACGQSEHQVSHLPAGTKTAWYCDLCGKRFRLNVHSADEIDLEVIANECRVDRLVTLRSDVPVTLLVKGFTLLPDDDEIGHARYFYDEHTCPTNFLGNVEKVIGPDGDDDPHGIFRFVSIEPWPEEKP